MARLQKQLSDQNLKMLPIAFWKPSGTSFLTDFQNKSKSFQGTLLEQLCKLRGLSHQLNDDVEHLRELASMTGPPEEAVKSAYSSSFLRI